MLIVDGVPPAVRVGSEDAEVLGTEDCEALPGGSGAEICGTLRVLVPASSLPLGAAERYAHALAGGAILGSGMAIRFLGL